MATFGLSSLGDVEGLGFAAGAMPWGWGPLVDVQRDEASRAGLPEGPSDDHIFVDGGGVASAVALASFRRQSESIPGDVVGTLAAPLGSWAACRALGGPVRLVRARGGGAFDAERAARATAVEIPVTSRSFAVRVGDRPGGRALTLELGDAVLCPIGHWSGVLWANLLALGPMLWRRLLGPPPLAAVRLGWACLSRLTWNRYRLARALSVVERGASVHPSAVVEGSWVRAGAVVGPQAVVRGCVVGPEASVEAHASIQGTVLGRGAVVQRHGWAWFSVLGDGAGVGGAMQLGVLAAGAQLKGGAYLMDQAIGGEVKVLRHHELCPAPLGMIGVGLGAGAIVGSGVWVAPGRSVPPGAVLASTHGLVSRWPPTADSGVRLLSRSS